MFRTAKALVDAPNFSGKEFLISVMELARTGYGDECVDILAECGVFYLIEAGDDVTSLRLFEGADGIDLTDPDRMFYEYVTESEDGRFFALPWLVGNGGGPVFFVPKTMEAAFRRVLPG